MPATFSKPVTNEAAASIKRSYEEPIAFVPQPDKANVVKARKLKIPLRQNPADPDSEKVDKIFMEFVENTPEAFCQWRCDMDEYIQGAGLTAPTAKLQAGHALLGPQHKPTWDNIVTAMGNIQDDVQVMQVCYLFALNFMDNKPDVSRNATWHLIPFTSPRIGPQDR
jgi:hypothetical protein